MKPMTKYDLFEREQQQLQQQQQKNDRLTNNLQTYKQTKPVKPENQFDSNSYSKIEFKSPNENSPIISSLIERGHRLKNEMLKTSNNLNNIIDPNNHHLQNSSNHLFTSTSKTINNNRDSDLMSMMLKQTSLTSNYIDPMANYSYLSEDFENNILNDPTYETSYLYANNNSNRSTYPPDEDKELKELLEPSNLFTRLIKQPNKSQMEPVKLANDNKNSRGKSPTIRGYLF